MAWEALAGSFLEGAGKGLTAPAGPSNASGRQDAGFDSSGWNIVFGAGSSIDSKRNQEQAGNFDQYLPYILAAAAVLIVWRLSKPAR